MKTVEVSAAVIFFQDKILCTQRGEHKYDYLAYKYEFAGGKIEEGETQEQALAREIKEELNMDIQINEYLTTIYHEYPDFALKMHVYICSAFDAIHALKDHVDSQWLYIQELGQLDWAEADLPVIEKIEEWNANLDKGETEEE